MKLTKTYLEDCFVIEPELFKDERGLFFESYSKKTFQETLGKQIHFVQDNQSESKRGVLRGFHYQAGEYAQAKLVRVLKGLVFDVAVDLRPDSLTYKKHFAIELSAENKKQLFIPRGFAHGFQVLSETATFFYKCDNFYNPKAESGVLYKDPQLNINWPLTGRKLIISDTDLNLPTLEIEDIID